MIVSLGDAVVDLVALGLESLPGWGEDREVESIRRQLGGAALNVAASLAALDEEVALLAAVGHDEWGAFLARGAQRLGIDVGGLVHLPAPTAVTMVLSGGADRAFISVYGATARYAERQLDEGYLARSRHLHISGYWQGRALQPDLPGLCRALRARGVTVSLDTGYDPDQRWGEPLPALLDEIDLFFPNEDEARGISGLEDEMAALDWLAGRVRLVVLKLGERGAIAARGDERIALPAFPVEVVDTTGAGDAFNAGFLHAWLRGWPLVRALEWAIACGALAVTRVGSAENAPGFDQVAAFLERAAG